ncbi:hypothetical protein CCPUN_07400 [Cardinium endosymbiont of Culicoides punctatus]|nr:hypothetical protein CCPUN_07400 [Cardinium endosymbiont of Culicoides punctatus]
MQHQYIIFKTKIWLYVIASKKINKPGVNNFVHILIYYVDLILILVQNLYKTSILLYCPQVILLKS